MRFPVQLVRDFLGVQRNFEALTPALFDTGDLKATTRSSAPVGWVLAQGQTLERAEYPELWAVAQDEIAAGNLLYGAGDGATTFTVADLRGRMLVGPDPRDLASGGRLSFQSAKTLGQGGGQDVVALTVAEMPAHGHGFAYRDVVVGNPAGSSTPQLRVDAANNVAFAAGAASNPVQSAGGGGNHTNMSPYLVGNWLIKT